VAAGAAGGLSMARRWLAAAVAAATLVLMPGTASALLFWTLVGTPLVVTANQSTTFTLKATNLDPISRLACVEVELPPSFVIEEAEVVSSSRGSWSAEVFGQLVMIDRESGSRLRMNDYIVFTIQASSTAAGAFTWPNHAHTGDCSDIVPETGVPLAVTVLPAPTPPPTPSPSPSPTPTPKPTPTPSPRPSLPLPSVPLPSLPLPTAHPTPEATPTPSPSPTPAPSRPAESPTPDPSPTPGATDPRPGAPPSQPPGPAGDPLGAVQLAPAPTRGFDGQGVDLGAIDLLADVQVWSVPAVAMGVPGLLLIAWVALQAAGVLAWIPAVRRMRGDDRDRRRPRRR
jgi:hypothetical protein